MLIAAYHLAGYEGIVISIGLSYSQHYLWGIPNLASQVSGAQGMAKETYLIANPYFFRN